MMSISGGIRYILLGLSRGCFESVKKDSIEG